VLLDRAEHQGATWAQNRADASWSAANFQRCWKSAISVAASIVNNLSESVWRHAG
jgi:hypothetical protein